MLFGIVRQIGDQEVGDQEVGDQEFGDQEVGWATRSSATKRSLGGSGIVLGTLDLGLYSSIS